MNAGYSAFTNNVAQTDVVELNLVPVDAELAATSRFGLHMLLLRSVSRALSWSFCYVKGVAL